MESPLIWLRITQFFFLWVMLFCVESLVDILKEMNGFKEYNGLKRHLQPNELICQRGIAGKPYGFPILALLP